MNSKYSTILIVLLALFAPIGYYLYQTGNFDLHGVRPLQTFEFERPLNGLQTNAKIPVWSVKVYDGYRFSLLLDTNEWVDVELFRATKPQATDVIVDLFQRGEARPVVHFLRPVDEFWVVDLIVTIDGKECSLVDWLASQNLVY